jgi:hypothetical protein
VRNRSLTYHFYTIVRKSCRLYDRLLVFSRCRLCRFLETMIYENEKEKAWYSRGIELTSQRGKEGFERHVRAYADGIYECVWYTRFTVEIVMQGGKVCDSVGSEL